jgi:hypothetical protein
MHYVARIPHGRSGLPLLGAWPRGTSDAARSLAPWPRHRRPRRQEVPPRLVAQATPSRSATSAWATARLWAMGCSTWPSSSALNAPS